MFKGGGRKEPLGGWLKTRERLVRWASRSGCSGGIIQTLKVMGGTAGTDSEHSNKYLLST